MSIPKRTIDEVRVRLKLEKKIKEIYVEGTFDKALLKWILNHLGIGDVQVYGISSVEIPASTLLEFGLTEGNRQRVIALSKSLINDSNIHPQIIALIDADLDYILNCAEYESPLISTAETSLELILWKNEVLSKFFSMVLNSADPESDIRNLKLFVEPIVKSISLLRAVRQQLGRNWQLIDIEKSFDRKNSFLFSTYCKKVADKNGIHAEINGPVLEAITKLSAFSETLDIDKQLHGHDLMACMAQKLSIDGFTQKCLEDFHELSRHLMSSLEWAFVKDNKIVQEINLKFGA